LYDEIPKTREEKSFYRRFREVCLTVEEIYSNCDWFGDSTVAQNLRPLKTLTAISWGALCTHTDALKQPFVQRMQALETTNLLERLQLGQEMLANDCERYEEWYQEELRDLELYRKDVGIDVDDPNYQLNRPEI